MSVDMSEYERIVAEQQRAEQQMRRRLRFVLVGALIGVVWILARLAALPDSVVLLIVAGLVVVPFLAPLRRL